MAGGGENAELTFGADVDVGGSGGAAGNGAAVTVTNRAALQTSGTYSHGIVAHSLGGGGGDGGTASSYTLNLVQGCALTNKIGSNFACNAGKDQAKFSTGVTVEVGGSGGAAGDGGLVTLDNQAAVTTEGDHSHAIRAQSHGGGGGNGGAGDMGIAAWTSNATADGFAELGAFLINPAGGQNQVSVGGKEGASGQGGAVDVTNSGPLTTMGFASYGILAQSVGGGGGTGGAGQNTGFGLVTVGGSGSGGGDGGAVTVESPGAIVTAGEDAIGIFAQSLGGGGGAAGNVAKAFAGDFPSLNIGVGVGIQLDAGDGGDGGPVSVTSGPITTSGPNAHGILAQSTGGSGGVSGISGLLGNKQFNWAGSAGDSGNSGPVTVQAEGPISVSGDQAHAIIAQSVSGSSIGNTSGDITIEVLDDVLASGADSIAILAQSQSALAALAEDLPNEVLDLFGDNGHISISIGEGATVASGQGSAVTVSLWDGRENVLTNEGTLLHLGGPDSTVVQTLNSTGLLLNNSGFLSGSVIASEANLMNAAGASFELGTTVDLDLSNSVFSNAGLITAGRFGELGSSTVTSASFEQTSSGAIQPDLVFPGTSDLITIAGDTTASTVGLAGAVQPLPIGGLPQSDDTGRFQILATEGRAIAATDLSVSNTATVNYSLMTGTADDLPAVFLDYEIDYTPWTTSPESLAKVTASNREVLTGNHTSFGDHVDELVALRRAEQESGGEDFAFVEDLVLQLLVLEDVTALLDVYDRFAPPEVFAGPNAALFSSQRFAEQLNSCPDRAEDGSVIFGREGECAWTRPYGGVTDRQRDGRSIDYDEEIFGLSGGFQAALAGDWFAGFALGFERSHFDNARFEGEALRYQAGAVVKKVIGATTLSGSLSGGYSDGDFVREVMTRDGTVAAASDPDLWWVAGHARLKHDLELGEGLRLTPWIDVGLEHQRQGDFGESGAGDFGLQVGDVAQTFVTFNPMLQLLATPKLGGIETAVSAQAGLLAITGDTHRKTELSLTGVSDRRATFTVRDDIHPLYANLGAAIEAKLDERATLELSFDALVGDNQQTYTGGLRLNFKF